MTLRVVVDTNLWIRALLGGRTALPLLEAWYARTFTVVVSQALVDERVKSGGVPGSGSGLTHRMRIGCWSNCGFVGIWWNSPRCHLGVVTPRITRFSQQP